ncbi:protein-export membrane protein SecF [Desulfoluna limicola]|uniref:Protein-export membrane protein SecF n=1 Tax=Desulfoluna limicola TaxID=2810562 RepID=A0ABN6F2C7_9BACT|nr:protein translocase subunit SecF [Desulfoluna limicola]BCS96138.1 protein-export membrane protein SecF [Desulfoluna limicola]
MQFIKETNINFTGVKKIAFGISLALIAISLLTLIVHKGPRYGVDFAGGSSLQVKFEGPVDIAAVKRGLEPAGLAGASVQQFGSDSDHEYQIRTKQAFMTDSDFAPMIKKTLGESTGTVVRDLSLDMVGPQVSKDLRQNALLAMFYALLFIIIYISGRFELKWGISGALAAILGGAVYGMSQLQSIAFISSGMPFLIVFALLVSIVFCWFLELKYAMGAIIALIHDVTITVGIFSLLNVEFTLPIIAALLTIIGYSLNDTIIVFDRIRENGKKLNKKPMDFIINRSVNETLSRTILTSGTTLMVVLALFAFGGGVIHDFALAMIIGVTIGTYSSIYVASPILLAWKTDNE